MSKFNEIKPDQLFIDRVVNNTFGNMIYFKYDTQKKYPLRVVLPKMKAPFGAANSDKFPGTVKLQLGFDGMGEDTPLGRKMQEAHEKMREIDDKIVQLLVSRSKDCFLAEKSADYVNELYNRRTIQKSVSEKGVEYPDKISLRLQRAFKIVDGRKISEDTFQGMRNTPFLVDAQGEEIKDVTLDNIQDKIPRNSFVKPVVELSYAFAAIKSKKVTELNVVWTLEHAIIIPGPPPTGFKIDLEEDDEYCQSEVNDNNNPKKRSAPYGGYKSEATSYKEMLQDDDEEERVSTHNDDEEDGAEGEDDEFERDLKKLRSNTYV